jgi:hypothetical protein
VRAVKRLRDGAATISLAALIILSSVPPDMVRAQTTGSDVPEGACVIPKANPVHVKMKEGRRYRISCVDGEIVVTSTKLAKKRGKSRLIHAESTEGPDYEITKIYPDGTITDGDGIIIDAEDDIGEGQVEAEGAASNGTQSACNVESTAYDNSGADIRMTWYGLSLSWRWKANHNNIKRLGDKYAFIGRERKTGWFPVTEGKPDVYQKEKNKRGDWTKQGMEGRIDFNGVANLYPHTHNVILWVNRDGDCFGDAFVHGILPNYAYTDDSIYQTPYRPA